MSTHNRGLGKGLDALLKGFNEHKSDSEIMLVPVASIEPNPFQPRKTFNEESLKDLAASIKAQGVLQPVLIRKTHEEKEQYQLIAGERRWRASQLAHIELIPAIVKTLSDNDCFVVAMIENLQREDLNPIEEALGLQTLQKQLKINQEKLAQHVGKSRSAVANSLRLLQLPEPIQAAVKNGDITAGHARTLLILSEEAQLALFQRILTHDLSVRATEAAVSYWKDNEELPPESHTDTPKKSKRAAATEKLADAAMIDIANKIEETLSLPVKVKGNTKRGQLVVHFSSNDQFRTLLSRLGIEPQ